MGTTLRKLSLSSEQRRQLKSDEELALRMQREEIALFRREHVTQMTNASSRGRRNGQRENPNQQEQEHIVTPIMTTLMQMDPRQAAEYNRLGQELARRGGRSLPQPDSSSCRKKPTIKGATKTAIDRLPTRKWSTADEKKKQKRIEQAKKEQHSKGELSESLSIDTEDNEQCGICLMEYQKGDLLRTLPCLHVFHAKCVDHWLKQKALCPQCRQPACPS